MCYIHAVKNKKNYNGIETRQYKIRFVNVNRFNNGLWFRDCAYSRQMPWLVTRPHSIGWSLSLLPRCVSEYELYKRPTQILLNVCNKNFTSHELLCKSWGRPSTYLEANWAETICWRVAVEPTPGAAQRLHWIRFTLHCSTIISLQSNN